MLSWLDLVVFVPVQSIKRHTAMTNNSSQLHTSQLSNGILLPTVVFKFIAMIIGVGGNITVIIYTIFLNRQKTATSYLVGNLALADLLMCLTFYPIWIIEIIQTVLNIESDQDLFCKFSRSSSHAFLFASVGTLLAITVDRYLFIVRPLRYPLIVTKRRVIISIFGIWSTTCCIFIVFVNFYKSNEKLRSFCTLNYFYVHEFIVWFFVYLPLCLLLNLNVCILIVAEKQRKRILAEAVVPLPSCHEETGNKMAFINRFFRALKAVKTFGIVFAVLVFCVITPAVAGRFILKSSCTGFGGQLWFVVFHYELYGINSIVNAFIYGMRHIKYRKAQGQILIKIFSCNKQDV